MFGESISLNDLRNRLFTRLKRRYTQMLITNPGLAEQLRQLRTWEETYQVLNQHLPGGVTKMIFDVAGEEYRIHITDLMLGLALASALNDFKG